MSGHAALEFREAEGEGVVALAGALDAESRCLRQGSRARAAVRASGRRRAVPRPAIHL